MVAQNEMIDATDKGQPQGIAPTAANPSVVWLGRSNPFPLKWVSALQIVFSESALNVLLRFAPIMHSWQWVQPRQG